MHIHWWKRSSNWWSNYFSSRDSNWVILSHEDALVLTLGVGGFDIPRILVDPSNSTNLLQISTYRQMGYSTSALENLGCVLSIFNKATTISLGNVVLPIQAGLTTLNAHLFVVDNLSPYNTIMGRIWLLKMEVILSTYHQMVSYLIKVEQVDLHGSSLAAQQCYQVAVESRQ